MRPIDADALIKWLNDTYCDMDKRTWNYDHHVMAMDMIEILKNYPTVEERKHGHWDNRYRCNVCGAYMAIWCLGDALSKEDNHYCYNCGAIMDEVNE